MIYPIVLYGAKVLREKTEPVPEELIKSERMKKFIDDMYESMYAAEGIGLSAPQIGFAIRVFVVDGTLLYDEKDNPDPTLKDFKEVFINPQIIEKEPPEITVEEGCLSFPKLRIDIKRPDKVKIKYYNQAGELITKTYEGFAARMIQHEYDHLEGILFIDHLKGIKRKFINSKLKQIMKGKVKTNYKVLTKEKAPLRKELPD